MRRFITTSKIQLSKLGQAMLIPIVALPVAGLLFRFGQDDLFGSMVMQLAANVIFGQMPLLFTVGMILAYTKTKDKAIPLLAGVLSIMVFKDALVYFNPSTSMGVFAGIVTGGVIAYLFDKSRFWKIPTAFSLFGGEKLILTIGPIVMVPLAWVFSVIWPPMEAGLNGFALWLGTAGMIGVFLFGFLNRLLIPTGLHHVLNAYIFYELGTYVPKGGKEVHGEVARFLAGDPTAGTFMSMFFVIMLFGISGAAAAIISCADEEKKKATRGLLSSGALTAFLAGTTEPVEFTFMFASPLLYVIHSLYTGLAGAILYVTGTKIGFTFGFNIFDLVLNWKIGTNVHWIPIVGVCYFALYFFSFRLLILKNDIKTPGRRDFLETAEKNEAELSFSLASKDYDYLAKKILQHIGGTENVVDVTNCATRLRLELDDTDKADVDKLKQLNVLGVVKLNKKNLQIIIGPEVSHVIRSFEAMLN